MHRESTFAILVVGVLAWTGCAEPSLGRGGTSRDVVDVGALAKAFWSVRAPLEYEPIESPRIAIVEFTVEYVSSAETGEARTVDFGTGMRLELPGVLYQGFVAELPEFDRHSVPLATVSGAAAYKNLEGVGIADVSLAPTPEDGNTRYPVDGLLCLTGDEARTDAVLVDLIGEVEADLGLLVRQRVGVRDGRASIEYGSTFRVVAAGGSGMVESNLTLVSAESVVEEEPDSQVMAIDSKRFVRAIQRLFGPCIAMALVATGRNV